MVPVPRALEVFEGLGFFGGGLWFFTGEAVIIR